MVNSAGVNFGKPNEDFIIESDGNGAITSARNAVTGDEYINENYIEVITGTLDAPFGNYVIADLISMLQAGDISGEIFVDGSSMGFTNQIRLPISYIGTGSGIGAEAATISNTAVTLAVQFNWRSDGVNQYRAYMNNTVVNLPGTLPTEVKLYHHPMP